MLGGLIWQAEPELQTGKQLLETGHDLRKIVTRIRNLGLLHVAGGSDPLEEGVQQVARLWFNNMRFVSTAYLEGQWRTIGAIRGQRSMKKAAAEFHGRCAAILKRCEVLWQRRSYNRS